MDEHTMSEPTREIVTIRDIQIDTSQVTCDHFTIHIIRASESYRGTMEAKWSDLPPDVQRAIVQWVEPEPLEEVRNIWRAIAVAVVAFTCDHFTIHIIRASESYRGTMEAKWSDLPPDVQRAIVQWVEPER